MRWIEIDSFIGLDRREARKFRVLERRRVDVSMRLPALATKLRQMRVQAQGARSTEQRLAIARQAAASASLAAHIGQSLVGQRLKALADRLEAQGETPAEMGWLDLELDALAHMVAYDRAR